MIRSAVTLSLVSEAAGGPFVFWHDVDNAIRTASDLGFDALEVFPPDSETLRGLKLPSRIGDLKIAAIGTGAGWVKHRLLLCDPDPSLRKRAVDFVRSMIQAASELGAPTIIGSMQGRSTPTLDKPTARALLRESLEILDQEASKCGQFLLYEPLNRYETDQANTLEEGLERIHGLAHTKLLADWFHMNIEETNIARAISTAGSKVGHVHFADSNRSAVGYGHIDPLPIIRSLQSIQYAGYLSAEVFSRPDAVRAAEQTIRAFRSAFETT